MPELPELEVTKDRLRLALAGRRVKGTALRHPAVMRTVDPPLEALLEGHVRAVSRLGKFLDIATDNGLHLCVHLMLNGRLAVVPSAKPATRDSLLVLSLDDATDLRLEETGTKRRVQAHLTRDPKTVAWIAEAGLDPLGPAFTINRFRSALGRRNRTVKRFLTEQRAVAGIGNAYSDEILFEARLSPFKHTGELKPEETIRLFMAVKKVLHDAILHLRTLDHLPTRRDRTFLRVHDRLGQPCPKCGTAVRRVSYTESTTFYCPGCQTGGRVLADRRLSRLLR